MISIPSGRRSRPCNPRSMRGCPGALGIHIEGPFLNWARRGVHDPKHLRRLDNGVISLLCSLRGGRTVLTLAPEMTTTDMIAQLAAGGILVSAGHSDASYAQTAAAIAHGVRGFTHLFNAMAPLAPREPGIVGAALYDREHLVRHHRRWPSRRSGHAEARVCAASAMTDSCWLRMPCRRWDLPATSFVLQGRTIRVVDGVCRDENGTLAGTGLDMATAVRNAVHLLGLTIAEAARMASEYPGGLPGTGSRTRPHCAGLPRESGALGRCDCRYGAPGSRDSPRQGLCAGGSPRAKAMASCNVGNIRPHQSPR